jgi:hypothetical protein
MGDEERQERYEAQTRAQFEALGRFVQAFEHMVFALRNGLEARLQQESRNMVYFTRMLLHHSSLTAGPLWEMFRAVVYTDVSELRPTTPPDAELFHRALTRIGDEVGQLVKARNNILHGTPFIGWANPEQDDFSSIDILKWGVSAKGWKVANTPKSAEDILRLVERCQAAETAIRDIRLASGMAGDARARLLERSVTAVQK